MNGLSEPNTFAIHLKLFKRIRFYHLFDPSSKKVFSYNIYQLIFILIVCIFECILIYGVLSNILDVEETTDISTLLIIFDNLVNLMNLIKTMTFVYKANDIWELLNVKLINLLTSEHCRKHNYIYKNYESISTKILYLLGIISIMGICVWGMIPFMFYKNSFGDQHADGTTNRRIENIINFRYWVTVSTYNKYFISFYILELYLTIFFISMHAVFEVFFILFSLFIVAQYKIITRAFKYIGYNKQIAQNNNENGSGHNFYNEYKSIIIDQQKVYLMLKSFFNIMQFIIHTSIALLSSGIIILSYSISMLYLSKDSLKWTKIIKVFLPFSSICLELYLYCFLLDIINIKKEAVLFGMYSSDWTGMDLKTRKFLLFAMRMENANKLMIKITPKKIVNLCLFASVIMTSYNIVSVMVKSQAT